MTTLSVSELCLTQTLIRNVVKDKFLSVVLEYSAAICLHLSAPLSRAAILKETGERERESYCKGLGELRTSGELFIMNNSIISEVCVAMVMRQSGGGGQEGHLHCCRQSAAQEDGAGQSEQASSQIPEHFSTCTSNSVAVMVRIKKMISRKT